MLQIIIPMLSGSIIAERSEEEEWRRRGVEVSLPHDTCCVSICCFLHGLPHSSFLPSIHPSLTLMVPPLLLPLSLLHLSANFSTNPLSPTPFNSHSQRNSDFTQNTQEQTGGNNRERKNERKRECERARERDNDRERRRECFSVWQSCHSDDVSGELCIAD